MIEYRILPPETSDTGKWQLECRDEGSFVWSISTYESHGLALQDAIDNGYKAREEQ